MVSFAGYEVAARQDRRLRGIWSYGLGATAMTFAATLVTVMALTTQIRPEPWFDPRYAIPILGMILGNSMTGIALALNTLTTSVARERVAIEAQLCLGATRWQACGPVMCASIRNGMMPMINAMAAAGLVSLPGMMTGQMLAGVPPTDAVRYQILIMFLIVGATGLGVLMTVYGGADGQPTPVAVGPARAGPASMRSKALASLPKSRYLSVSTKRKCVGTIFDT